MSNEFHKAMNEACEEWLSGSEPSEFREYNGMSFNKGAWKAYEWLNENEIKHIKYHEKTVVDVGNKIIKDLEQKLSIAIQALEMCCQHEGTDMMGVAIYNAHKVLNEIKGDK